MFDVQFETGSFALTGAILLYGHANQRDACATKHRIAFEEGGSPVIKPGVPLMDEDLKDLVGQLLTKNRPRIRWHDERVLASGNGQLIWWSPPKNRPMFFRATPGRADSFDGKGVCAIPGLVFWTNGKSLQIYAIKGADRPTQSTQLYRAPFYNVWESNEVCTGNATCPEREDDIDGWEKMFFGSNFTHTNIPQKNQLIRGLNPRDFWKKMLDTPSETFPENRLVRLTIKAGELLKG
jgi:PRTRC genetic system protein B